MEGLSSPDPAYIARFDQGYAEASEHIDLQIAAYRGVIEKYGAPREIALASMAQAMTLGWDAPELAQVLAVAIDRLAKVSP